ncbi:MAG: ribonuclease III, partial [Oscillospiraceae bacterium]|nr:ribonuclease III [Oscillospiraceae bacterium]
KQFVMEVLINSNVVAEGSGKSKKQAEQAAAKAALALMGQ